MTVICGTVSYRNDCDVVVIVYDCVLYHFFLGILLKSLYSSLPYI